MATTHSTPGAMQARTSQNRRADTVVVDFGGADVVLFPTACVATEVCMSTQSTSCLRTALAVDPQPNAVGGK